MDVGGAAASTGTDAVGDSEQLTARVTASNAVSLVTKLRGYFAAMEPDAVSGPVTMTGALMTVSGRNDRW